MTEELSAGGPESSSRRGWLWVVVGVGVLAAGFVATGLIGEAPPQPPPAPSPSPVVYRTTRPGPLEYLDVTAVCRPHATGRRLTVSFTLTNVGGLGVRVLDVAPHLPLAGLTAVGPVRSGGTCSAPAREPVRQIVELGRSRVYTFTFRVKATCPTPYPVGASYRIEINGQQLTAAIPLLPDLGSVDFRSCD